MAVNHNFRSALGGFNRADVVRYIEYMNTKHAEQISELNTEAEQLREKLQQYENLPQQQARLDELEAKCAELTALLEQVKADNALLETKIADSAHEKELDAYRRAENIERQAKDRAEHLFQQAAGTLAQATTQVDNAATSFIGVADRITSQIDELRRAVETSKNALRDAATTMYEIRPTYTDK